MNMTLGKTIFLPVTFTIKCCNCLISRYLSRDSDNFLGLSLCLGVKKSIVSLFSH